jgi:hypothetical protein
LASNSNSITYPLDYIGRTIYIVLPLYYFIIHFISKHLKLITIMIYFFNSTRKADKLSHPVTVCAANERRATALAIINFAKNGYKGSPKLVAI